MCLKYTYITLLLWFPFPISSIFQFPLRVMTSFSFIAILIIIWYMSSITTTTTHTHTPTHTQKHTHEALFSQRHNNSIKEVQNPFLHTTVFVLWVLKSCCLTMHGAQTLPLYELLKSFLKKYVQLYTNVAQKLQFLDSLHIRAWTILKTCFSNS